MKKVNNENLAVTVKSNRLISNSIPGLRLPIPTPQAFTIDELIALAEEFEFSNNVEITYREASTAKPIIPQPNLASLKRYKMFLDSESIAKSDSKPLESNTSQNKDVEGDSYREKEQPPLDNDDSENTSQNAKPIDDSIAQKIVDKHNSGNTISKKEIEFLIERQELEDATEAELNVLEAYNLNEESENNNDGIDLESAWLLLIDQGVSEETLGAMSDDEIIQYALEHKDSD